MTRLILFLVLFQGLTGFEELKKYIRQGSDLCKDVAAIVQERLVLNHPIKLFVCFP